MKYSITGRFDGLDYGVFEGDNEFLAVKAMLEDAGSNDEPRIENWIVLPVSEEGFFE